MSEIKELRIPRSHIDNFNAHPGWWASFERPDLQPGDKVKIKLDDVEDVIVDVVRVDQGYKRPDLDSTQQFGNWWIIEYKREEVMRPISAIMNFDPNEEGERHAIIVNYIAGQLISASMPTTDKTGDLEDVESISLTPEQAEWLLPHLSRFVNASRRVRQS